jgi:predicted nucleic acid-binding protein
MNIVLDSNILFSALLKDSTTRKIILTYDGFFLFPSFIFVEMEKHKDELLTKSGMNRKDFDELLHMILKKVLVVPASVMKPYREEALSIVRDIDINDALFIACALVHSDSILWSDDKKLKNQSRVRILNTKEIIEYLKVDLS